jgi:hypothetical protein
VLPPSNLGACVFWCQSPLSMPCRLQSCEGIQTMSEHCYLTQTAPLCCQAALMAPSGYGTSACSGACRCVSNVQLTMSSTGGAQPRSPQRCDACAYVPCLVQTYAVHSDSVWALRASADWTSVYSGGRDCCVYRTHLATRTAELLVKGDTPVTALELGEKVGSGGEGANVYECYCHQG